MQGGIERLPERFDEFHARPFEHAGKFALDVDDPLTPGGIRFLGHRNDRALEIIENGHDLGEQSLGGGLSPLEPLLIGAAPEIGELSHGALQLIEVVVPFGCDPGQFLEWIEIFDLVGRLGYELFELVDIELLVFVIHRSPPHHRER